MSNSIRVWVRGVYNSDLNTITVRNSKTSNRTFIAGHVLMHVTRDTNHNITGYYIEGELNYVTVNNSLVCINGETGLVDNDEIFYIPGDFDPDNKVNILQVEKFPGFNEVDLEIKYSTNQLVLQTYDGYNTYEQRDTAVLNDVKGKSYIRVMGFYDVGNNWWRIHFRGMIYKVLCEYVHQLKTKKLTYKSVTITPENQRVIVFCEFQREEDDSKGTVIISTTEGTIPFKNVPRPHFYGTSYYIEAYGHRIEQIWKIRFLGFYMDVHESNVMTLSDFVQQTSDDLTSNKVPEDVWMTDVWVMGWLNGDIFTVKDIKGDTYEFDVEIMNLIDPCVPTRGKMYAVKMKGELGYHVWDIEFQGSNFTVSIDSTLTEKYIGQSLVTQKKVPQMNENKQFESGAQRSKDVDEYRYDLFHPIAMKRVAKVWATGANKYGAHNHEQGFPMPEIFNHLLAHCFEYLSGDRSEDHLAHMACNVSMLLVEDEMRYDSNKKYLRDEGNKLSKEMLEEIKAFRDRKKLKES